MIDDPKTDDSTQSEEAEEMEKVQEDAAKKREENGGYQYFHGGAVVVCLSTSAAALSDERVRQSLRSLPQARDRDKRKAPIRSSVKGRQSARRGSSPCSRVEIQQPRYWIR